MNSLLEILGKAKLAKILREIAERFELSLTLMNQAGSVLIGPDKNCTCAATCGQESPHSTRTTRPIHFRNDVVGSIVIHAPHVSEKLADAAAYSLENLLRFEIEITDLSGEVVRVYEELSLLYSLTEKLGSEMDVDAICARVLEEVEKVLGAQNLSIMLADATGNKLQTTKSMGRDAAAASGFSADMTTGFMEYVLRQGGPLTICDIQADGRITLPYPAKSILCVPLITDSKAIGLLLACDKLSGEEFWSRELKLMGMFAMEVAASIRKAQLYQDINTMFTNTVGAFATAIDAKDPYTYGHSRRVAQLSVAICEKMRIPKDRTRLVELAAFLHDIGKIGTPESILHKPGALQPEEYEKIKEHPAKGAEILSGIKEFHEIIKWIRHHHEWYDGKGYPDKIAEKHIPIEARIITIADAYDAMTSDRPYRKGMPSGEVMKIMEEFTRSQFDPNILKAFREILQQEHAGIMATVAETPVHAPLAVFPA